VTSTRRQWRVRLSDLADTDFQGILLWTENRFGEEQARIYEEALIAILASLSEGPSTPGARSRPEVGKGLHTLHVAGTRRRARHLVLFRVVGDGLIEIVRILHDGMDLARHLPTDEAGET
jgi:toxin ParE1/3/4